MDWKDYVTTERDRNPRASIRRMSQETGVSPYRISKLLADRGIESLTGRKRHMARADLAVHSNTPFARAIRETALGVPKVARILRVSAETVHDWMRGKRAPQPVAFAALDLILAVGADEAADILARGEARRDQIEQRHLRSTARKPVEAVLPPQA